jgi:hypothetical protein
MGGPFNLSINCRFASKVGVARGTYLLAAESAAPEAVTRRLVIES